MIRLICASILFSIGAARAQEPMPPALSFGYEEEGKVDASDAACEAWVKDMVEWSEEDMKRAISQVCTARKRHVAAYAAIQKSYKALADQIHDNVKLEPAAAVKGIEALVKACIDHKSALTYGGHNIMIDVIPNEIAARCLEMGKNVLDEEVAWLSRDPDKEDPAAHASP